MTRAEQLAHAEERARTALQEQRRKLNRVQSAQKAEQRKALDRRRYQVGALVLSTALATLDDATLGQLMVVLSQLADVPNPVAMLASLLCDPSGSPGMSVHGMARPQDGVARDRASGTEADTVQTIEAIVSGHTGE